MKPAKAAIVFEQLDLDVQLKVARKMRERSTGMMLAAMTPKGAARLTMAMARAPRLTAAR
jgi:flagellar motility protein MotE (MotC chaperone)